MTKPHQRFIFQKRRLYDLHLFAKLQPAHLQPCWGFLFDQLPSSKFPKSQNFSGAFSSNCFCNFTAAGLGFERLLGRPLGCKALGWRGWGSNPWVLQGFGTSLENHCFEELKGKTAGSSMISLMFLGFDVPFQGCISDYSPIEALLSSGGQRRWWGWLLVIFFPGSGRCVPLVISNRA